MSRFENPEIFFHAIYQDRAPWDIGRLQPSLVELVDAQQPKGPALDLGCGTGDVARELAGPGTDVLGINLAPIAIAQAREYAAPWVDKLQRRVALEVPNTPHTIRTEEIEEAFSDAARWAAPCGVRKERFHSRVAPPVPEVAACAERD